MNKVKISVLMAVYNTPEQYLRDAIESILNQTYTGFEFIIVDDGSTKNNVKNVIKSYSDTRIKYLHKDNGGLANALNFGWKYCRGEYIARMDSDDISLPTRLQKQVEYLDKHTDVSLLGTWFKTFPIDQPGCGCHKKDIKLLDILCGWCINHPTVMLRKSDFDKFNLRYDPNYAAEDYQLWSEVVKVLKIENLQEILLMYRMENTNTTVKRQQNMKKSTLKTQNNLLQFLTNDKKLQDKIINILHLKERKNILKQIFSINNDSKGLYKILIVFGLKIKIKKNTKCKIDGWNI